MTMSGTTKVPKALMGAVCYTPSCDFVSNGRFMIRRLYVPAWRELSSPNALRVFFRRAYKFQELTDEAVEAVRPKNPERATLAPLAVQHNDVLLRLLVTPKHIVTVDARYIDIFEPLAPDYWATRPKDVIEVRHGSAFIGCVAPIDYAPAQKSAKALRRAIAALEANAE